MKSTSVLFKRPMVRAILEGRKTQTRRVVKPQPPECEELSVGHYHTTVIGRGGIERPGREQYGACDMWGKWTAKCPYGKPGDELWVRETWRACWGRVAGAGKVVTDPELAIAQHGGGVVSPSEAMPVSVLYAADEETWNLHPLLKNHPSIHMPRWASRLTLTVTGVRVERLQDITEGDAIAEGVERNWDEKAGHALGQEWDAKEHGWMPYDGDASQEGFPAWNAKESFKGLWESINGPSSWAANPWVWVVEFERKAVS